MFVSVIYCLYYLFSYIFAPDNQIPNKEFLMQSGGSLIFITRCYKAICLLQGLFLPFLPHLLINVFFRLFTANIKDRLQLLSRSTIYKPLL